MSPSAGHWILWERAAARSRRPSAEVSAGPRRARRHLALVLRAEVDVAAGTEEDRDLLAGGAALVRGQLDLLQRVGEKPE